MKKTTLSKRNKDFWASTPDQKRVQVAKDVIKQIQSNFYNPEHGTYFQFDIPDEIGVTDKIEKFDKALDSVKRKGGHCDVCAIGACFASLVRLGDKVDTSYIMGSVIENGDSIGDTFMKGKLRDVFSTQQLSLIECAFERSAGHGTANIEDREKARDWGYEQSSNDTKRLIAIMKNIIKNKGVFKL